MLNVSGHEGRGLAIGSWCCMRRVPRVLTTVLATAVAATLALAACGDSGGPAGRGRSLTIALSAEPVKWLHPLNDNSSAGIQIAQAMFAPLVETDPDTGKLRNVVAESLTPDATSQTWTIKIKSGFTFQNGQPLTAKDYVDSWNLAAYGPNA